MNGNEGQWMTMNDNERSWMTMNDNELQRTIVNDRRKFRSQTSDNMDRWKSRGGKSQRREKKKEDQRRERVRGKKMQAREKVEKSRPTCFSNGVVRSTFGSQNVESTSRSDLEVEMSQSARHCGTKHISKSKCAEHQVRSTFGRWDVEKVHAVVARSTFSRQNVKNTTCSNRFWSFRCGFAWQAQGILHLAKSEQNVRVLQHFQKRYAQRYWSPSVICNGMLDEVLDLDVSRRLSDRERMLSHVQWCEHSLKQGFHDQAG